MATIINGKYRVKNSQNEYDIVHLETSASQVKFSDGKTFQDKLNNGSLKGEKGDKGIQGEKGDKGDKGQDGLTTSVTVGSTKYSHVNGNITLPSYPSTPASVGAEPANVNIQAHISSTHAPSNAQKNSDITKSEIEAKLTGVITSHTHNYETPQNVQSKVDTALNNAKKYADEKVSSLVSSAPETLDTLQELAKALGNDPNFATTVSNKIGEKADTSYVNTELNKKADVSHGTHVVYGGNGSATTVSRSDHSHTPQTSVTGNAGTATKLATARKINGVSFDGTSDITILDSTKVSPTGTIVANRVAVFNDTTGKVIKDGGFTIATSVPANAKFTDTVYTHPSTHDASMITQSSSYRFVTDTEKSNWNLTSDKINEVQNSLRTAIVISEPIIQVGSVKYKIGVTKDGRLTCSVVTLGDSIDFIVKANNGTLYKVSATSNEELVTEVVTSGTPKELYVQAVAPYGAIYKIGVLDDGSLVACPIADVNFIDDNTLSDEKTWSSYNINKNINAVVKNNVNSISDTINNLDKNINDLNTSINNKLDKNSIFTSSNEPIDSYGEDGDIWIVHEELDVLTSVTFNGTTVKPLSNKDYLGVFSNTSKNINEMNGTIYCTSVNVSISGFTVNVNPGFTYRFINYNTGEQDKTTTMVNVNNVPTTLLEVTHSKSLKKYLYKLVGIVISSGDTPASP